MTTQTAQLQQRIETLGPAERVIKNLLEYQDHLFHGRTGIIVPNPTSPIGVTWAPVSWRDENGQKVVYGLTKIGRGSQQVRLGVVSDESGTVAENGRVVGQYREPGIFPELATYMYKQVAEVWRLDNEFVAKWASHAWGQEHRDLKTVLAAFLLVQSRCGEPIKENGQTLFYDDDHRDVGEAMCLLRGGKDKEISPKMLLRVGEVLRLPQVAEINRELGFGQSARTAPLGRWPKVVSKWLRYREQNVPMLTGLVNSGMKTTVMRLAQLVGYKPLTPQFFETLRWKQKQSTDGRRSIAIGQEWAQAETWVGLSEREVCERIIQSKFNFKKVVGLLPKEVGLTRAVMAASIQANALSDADLIIMTPTLEELGLLNVQEIKARWQQATLRAENQRASNISKRVRNKETAEALQVASDTSIQKTIEKVTRDMRVYFMVDISGSMSSSIEEAKKYLSQFLQGFPIERTHVCVFNNSGKAVQIKHPSAAGVEQAFRGIGAGGGTDYGSAVRFMANHKPLDGEDVLFFFVGDQEQVHTFTRQVNESGLHPSAFGVLHVGRKAYGGRTNDAVERTAVELGIPCFPLSTDMFNDPYAVSRTISNLVSATPVNRNVSIVQKKRDSIVETILKTDLLQKPTWAA